MLFFRQFTDFYFSLLCSFIEVYIMDVLNNYNYLRVLKILFSLNLYFIVYVYNIYTYKCLYKKLIRF